MVVMRGVACETDDLFFLFLLSNKSFVMALRRSAHEWSLRRIKSDCDVIVQIQTHRHPWLDKVMQVVSYFGDEIAFTLGLPVAAWSITMPAQYMMCVAWALTFYLGHSLKDVFRLPRPFVVDSRVVCLEQHFSAEYGLPSTHAQAVWCVPAVLLFASPLSAESLARWGTLALVYAVSVR
jgi:hypothetical protein